MPSALPIADPAPLDGSLPASVAAGAGERNFGVYVHVPFCRVRCGRGFGSNGLTDAVRSRR